MDSNEPPLRPLIEVCVGSVTDALAAAEAGADRLELCGATELGGLTPSAGLLEQVLAATSLPVIAMIRPRSGGFAYDRHEFLTAIRDAELAIERGVTGIAFGFLDSAGRIDVARCRELLAVAGERQTVFHRAFDFVPDVLAASDQLMELGVTRLLTSGQQATALEGLTTICAVSQRTFGRLEVMPGGGIRADDVATIVHRSGCSQLHIGASLPEDDGSLGGNQHVCFESAHMHVRGSYRAVQQALVAEIVSKARSIASVGFGA